VTTFILESYVEFLKRLVDASKMQSTQKTKAYQCFNLLTISEHDVTMLLNASRSEEAAGYCGSKVLGVENWMSEHTDELEIGIAHPKW